MNIDHIVLWVSDQKRSLDFYVNVVGLDPVRAQEFAEGGAGFPSSSTWRSSCHGIRLKTPVRKTAHFFSVGPFPDWPADCAFPATPALCSQAFVTAP